MVEQNYPDKSSIHITVFVKELQNRPNNERDNRKESSQDGAHEFC